MDTAALPAATTRRRRGPPSSSRSDASARVTRARASTPASAAATMAARCWRRREGLMQGVDFSPRGEFGHDVELSQQLPNDFARIVAHAELLELFHDFRERVFGLRDCQLRVVLALFFETSR